MLEILALVLALGIRMPSVVVLFFISVVWAQSCGLERGKWENRSARLGNREIGLAGIVVVSQDDDIRGRRA